MTASPLLTVPEAAEYLRVSTKTLARLRCEGGGPKFVGGGRGSRVTYRRTDLDAWINSRVRSTTSE